MAGIVYFHIATCVAIYIISLYGNFLITRFRVFKTNGYVWFNGLVKKLVNGLKYMYLCYFCPDIIIDLCIYFIEYETKTKNHLLSHIKKIHSR